ncbi:MAG: hypothetical protein U0168_08260 [Nannocystaceae bacterium]
MQWRPVPVIVRACAGLCLAAACGGSNATAVPQGSSSEGPGTDTGSTTAADGGESTADATSSGSSAAVPDAGTPDAPSWDPDPQPGPCAADRPSLPWSALVAHAGLDGHGVGFNGDDFAESAQFQAGVLGGDFAPSWLAGLRTTAARVGCFEGEVAGGFDHAWAQPHPVAAG